MKKEFPEFDPIEDIPNDRCMDPDECSRLIDEDYIDEDFATLYGPPPGIEDILDEIDDIKIIDNDNISDKIEIDEDVLINELKNRAIGLSRKIDEPMSFVYGPPARCSTRHGCLGTLNCDYEYASFNDPDPNLIY